MVKLSLPHEPTQTEICDLIDEELKTIDYSKIDPTFLGKCKKKKCKGKK